MPLVIVLLDGVRSAEPPMVAAQALLILSSAASDAFRVATDGFSSLVFFFCSVSAFSMPSGTSQVIAMSKSRVLRFSHAARALPPLAPIARQSDMMSSGITKGGDGQSR